MFLEVNTNNFTHNSQLLNCMFRVLTNKRKRKEANYGKKKAQCSISCHNWAMAYRHNDEPQNQKYEKDIYYALFLGVVER